MLFGAKKTAPRQKKKKVFKKKMRFQHHCLTRLEVHQKLLQKQTRLRKLVLKTASSIEKIKLNQIKLLLLLLLGWLKTLFQYSLKPLMLFFKLQGRVFRKQHDLRRKLILNILKKKLKFNKSFVLTSLLL